SAAKPGRVASASDRQHAEARAAATKAGAAQPPPPPAPPAAAKGKAEVAQKDDAKKADARKDSAVAKAGAAAGTGKVEFWINPFGDVFVDGKAIGSSPPLKSYDLTAGTHRIEVFNDSAGFPHKETIEVKAGEVNRITKTFR